MNLEENKEGNMKSHGGRKGKGKYVTIIESQK